ncbi:cupin domain-containing protein [Temperatibacter marinus]|uniref:Cupin domain-containing protein n=1 Tax=Temperatibacter marinus TaxID=1456591 RepID=A0AA52HA87_9PROT|nr:cupin domain-containing protein [Temperatibacter marinus]WND02333.1 cupin domain-containing protein [Temperatibacter marinus]
MDVINLSSKLALFTEQWTPKLVGEMDDYHVKLAKIEGDFVFHAHKEEDELFLVLSGRFRMDYRDRSEWVETGEMVIVPKGVEHKPFAEKECSVLLIEKASVDHTGGVEDPRRVENPDKI